jgi:hypothetical protein
MCKFLIGVHNVHGPFMVTLLNLTPRGFQASYDKACYYIVRVRCMDLMCSWFLCKNMYLSVTWIGLLLIKATKRTHLTMRLDCVLKVRHHSKSNTKYNWESLCDHLKNIKIANLSSNPYFSLW